MAGFELRSFKELAALQGRVALVLGGAGHVGVVACETLLELGATVVAADLTDRSPGPWPCLHVDLADEEGTRNTVQEVVKQYGRLDIMIHTAALVANAELSGWNTTFNQQTVAAWDSALRVNLTSAFVAAQAARGALQASGHGSVVLVSSIYGVVGPDFRLYTNVPLHNPAAYGASKAALIQLARYLATLFAPSIRVNAVTPGGIRRSQPDRFVEQYDARTPLQRMATEEDLKGAIGYLATDLSSYVTGHNLVVDGGWTAW